MTLQPEQWVRDGQHVRAVFATGDGTFTTGRVIAYTDRPTVTIERDDGTRAHWLAELCEPTGHQLRADISEVSGERSTA